MPHVICPKCSTRVDVDKDAASQRLVCSNCQTVLSVSPKQKPSAAETRSSPPKQTAIPSTTQNNPSPDQWRVTCANCNKSLKVAAALAGRIGVCPRCKAQFTVPDSPADGPEVVPFAALATVPSKEVIVLPNELEEEVIDLGALTENQSGIPAHWVDPMPQAQWSLGNPYSPQIPPVRSSVGNVGASHYGRPAFGHQQSSTLPAMNPSVIVSKLCGGAFVLCGIGALGFTLLGAISMVTMDEGVFLEQTRQVAARRRSNMSPEEVVGLVYLMAFIMFSLAFAVQVTLIVGGIALIRSRGFGWCIAGCVVAFLPCAIWTWPFAALASVVAIILMFNSNVKAEFERDK